MAMANLSGTGNFSLNDGIDGFRSAMAAHGLHPDSVIADGEVHRFSVEGDRSGKKSGWYSVSDASPMVGFFGNWKEGGDSHTWFQKDRRQMNFEERKAARELMAREKARRDRERSDNAAACVINVNDQWRSIKPASVNNAYAKKKGIHPYEARQMANGSLMILIQNADKRITSAQYIYPNSDKIFAPGGRVGGCFFTLRAKEVSYPDSVLICEGYATACTIYEAMGKRSTVVAALSANNIPVVAKIVKEKFPAGMKFVICAEDDSFKERNLGMEKATEAARAIGAALAVPEFGEDREKGQTDFNDMQGVHGLEAVAAVINAAQQTNGGSDEQGPGTHAVSDADQDRAHGSSYRGDPPAAQRAEPAADGSGIEAFSSEGAEGHVEEPIPLTAYHDEGSKEAEWIDPFPGVMEELFRASIKRQNRPQPVLTVAAALAGMSACMHGKYCLPDGLRGNLYVVGLAGSTAGKSGPLNLVKAIVNAAGGLSHSNIGSGQGIEDAISRDEARRASLVIDEVAHLIGAFSDKNSAHYMQHVGKMMLDFYSASESIFTTRLLADETKAPKKLFNPFLTLYGTTTHAKMQNISAGLIEDGTLGRCLVIDGEDFVEAVDTLETGSLFQDVNAVIGKLAKHVYEFGPVITFPDDGRVVVPLSDEARSLLIEIRTRFDKEARAAESARRTLLGRGLEQVKRVALVLAVWDKHDGKANRVEVRHVEWAMEFVRHSQKCLTGFVEKMTDDPIVAMAEKAVRIMRDAVNYKRPFGGEDSIYNTIAEVEGVVNRSALLRKLRTKAKMMHEVVSHLIDAGLAEEVKIDRDGIRGPKGTGALRLLKRR